MLSASIVATIVGILLILITFFDVFLTVLHPNAESPFSSRIQTFIWFVMRRAGRLLGRRMRHRFLGLGVPIMVVMLLMIWAGLLLVSFGLIYAGWINSPGAFNVPGSIPKTSWTDAMYFSGVTLGTVGYGDIQPLHALIRAAAVIEGFSGILVLSMSITYVLELYPVLQREAVLAVLLNEETAGQVSGLPLLVRYLRNGNFEALADLLRLVNLELLALAEAHRRLPVLHFIHPVDVERSFLRVLLVVQNIVGALRYGVAGGDGRPWCVDPRVQDLEDSLFYALYTLGSSLNLPLVAAEGGLRHEKDLEDTFAQMHARLTTLNLPVPGKEPGEGGKESEYDQARSGFVQYHITIDTSILSYLRNSGYSYDEAISTAIRPQKLVRELEPTGPPEEPLL